MVGLVRQQGVDSGRDRRQAVPGNSSSGRRAVFSDRIHAGQQLAGNLQQFTNDPSVVVLSISRGGAVVGSTVASALGPTTPHFYYVVRGIPSANIPRLSLGSVAGDGSVRIDTALAKSVDIETPSGSSWLMQSIEMIDLEVCREQMQFYGGMPLLSEMLQNKTLVVVDDGIESGDIMREAIMHLRHCYGESKIVVAVPVCLADLRRQLQRHVSLVVDVVSPVFVGSIARWYATGVVPSVAEQHALDAMFDGAGADSGFDAE
ncbi:hypothetical protein FB645_000245 [Coemansia sp. IMI 203386]|nr:hypothetical protein FB645_000245 [Coemansia sp. IMI 203386]